MRAPFASPLWRNRSFVRVWTAATISIFGSLITRLALPLVAIIVLEAGPFEIAVLRGLDLVSALLVGLVAGAWVDRLRRRPVLIWADVGRALVLVTVPLAFVAGVLSFWHLLAVAGVTAVLTTFFDAADNAYLPTIVERERLVDANAALAASGSAAEFTAFGIAGFLVQVLTAPIAILVDAATFLVSASLLGSIRTPEPPPPARMDREPILREIGMGVRLVIGSPILRAFAAAQMAASALFGVFGATWLLFAIRDLELGPVAVGLIAGVGGAASLAGALVAGRAARRFGVGRVAVASMLLVAAGNALIPLAPAGAPAVAILFLVGQQLVGDSAMTVYDVTETSVRQALVHERSLGRVSSTFRVAGGLAQLVGAVAAGLFAEVAGLRAAVAIAPLGALVGAALLWWSPVRTFARLPVDVPAPDTVAQAVHVVVEVGRDEPIGG